MSELPTAQPTTDLSWASTGATKTAPSAGQKTDGWDLNDLMVKGNHNWLWDAFERWLTWLFTVLPRAWDDLPQCIDGTAAGSLFMLEVTQAFADDPQTKASVHGSGFPITFLRTDGRRLYYIQDEELIAVTNRPGLSTSLEWSRDISSGGEDMGVPVALSTDGRIVVLVTQQAAAENSALIVNAATGAVLRKTNTIGGWADCVADSDSVGPEAYLVAGVADTNIYNMTDLAGPTVWLNAGGNHQSVTTTPNAVVTSTSSATIRTFDKAAVALVGGATYSASIGDIASDGAIIPTSVLDNIEATGPHGGAIWSRFDGNAGGADPITIDDRYVYYTTGAAVAIYALDKLDGSPLKTWTGESAGVSTSFASDGRYLWTNGASGDELTALALPRTPSYWLRLDGGLSGDYPYPLSMRALATAIARDTI